MTQQRLPIPGGDDGDWGDILNAYLTVSLASDGTLNSNAVGTNQIQSGAVTNAKLDAATQAQLTDSRPPNGPASGDLAGTYPGPTVAKLNGITLPGTTPVANQVLTASSGTTTTWTTPAGGVVLDGSASDIQPLGSQAAGGTGKAADAGHVHAMPRLDQINNPTAPVSLNSQKITGLANGTVSSDAAAFGQLPNVGGTAVGGDLSGTVSSATVAKVNGVTVSGTAGNGQALVASSSSAASWSALTYSQVGAAQNLTPTAVKANGSSPYSAVVGDFVPVDTTSGNVTVILPTTPADKSRIGVKQVIQGGSNTVTISAGGSDVFNKTGGSTSLTLSLLNQGVLLQYASSSGIWYVQADDLPLSGVAQLASPAFTGTPTAPTATALTSTTQIATTAYADAAVSVEKSRALAAEALLTPLLVSSTQQIGTTYTFALIDSGTVVEGNNASAQTFTVPPHSSVAWPTGTLIEVFQLGPGQITIAAGGGVTFRSDGSKVKTATQYASIGLRCRATDDWVLTGDLA